MLRLPCQLTGALVFSAAICATATTWAQNTAQAPNANPNQATNPNVIGTHQIDRFEAIRQLQESLRSKADSAADWIILGELAHEVALDLPADEADKYFKMSVDAYDHAARLEPNNAGVKAALDFAKEQQKDESKVEQQRKQAAQTYIDARRKELAKSNMTPTVQIYSAPAQAQATPAPVAAQPAATTITTAPAPTAVTQTLPVQSYPYPVYQPYVMNGNPYTYRQFANSYYGTGYGTGATTATTGAPMTLRQYSQQLPQVLMNSATQGFFGGRPR